MLTVFCLLIAGHALADYPLQGDFLAQAKNHRNPIVDVPFYQALIAHSVIHGAFVGLITGSVVLGIMETFCHIWIDYKKCDGALTYNEDQGMHIACKVLWIILMFLCEYSPWYI